MTDQRFRVNAPSVIHETLGDEVVIINLAAGTCYTLAGLGVQIWQALASGASTDEVVAQVEASYSTTRVGALESVSAFIDDLVTEGLLTPHDVIPVEPPRRVSAGTPGARFEVPIIDRFTGVQELGNLL
ncbi:PqqD family protein [Rhabdothermincola sp.]|uniref:PqqD family protein n=1 Tax=Rhabdothermincola sp. TaxID=2820405 RepID=UPI002FDFA805